MRVLRVCHAGRDASHRLRERALIQAGIEVNLVVPEVWPEGSAQEHLSAEPFRVIELAVRRPSDVNRHTYAADVADVIRDVQPDRVGPTTRLKSTCG